MNIEEFRNFCIQKAGVTEETPFGPDTLVFKVMGKLFALTDLNTFASINLKCDPELAITLREEYTCVKPGYHMNKKHWNTVIVDHSIADSLLKEWIYHSYNLVAAKLTKKEKEALKNE